MGAMELVVVGLAAGLSVGLWVVGTVVRSRSSGAAPEVAASERPALPWAWVAFGGLGLLSAPVVGWMLAPHWVAFLTDDIGPGLRLAAPTDALIARLHGALPLALWAAVPPVAAAAWALFSSRRSSRDATLFAASAGLGCTLGLGTVLVLTQMSQAVLLSQGAELGFENHVLLTDITAMAAKAGVGLSLFGTLAGGLVVLTASSVRDARAALRVAAALPFSAALAAALGTPPDPVTTLVLAVPLLVVGLGALGLGALTRAVLARGGRPPATA